MFGFKKPINTDEEKIEEILTRGVSEVVDRESLKKKLSSGKRLRIKLGIDPTSPDLHIGRAVPLLKLKDFQELGHTIVLIVGDVTGIIGDTSDKESERPLLTKEEVKKNAETYFKQAGKVLDMGSVEKHFNSEWLSKLSYNEIGEHADQFSLADFIARENIKKRLDAGKRVSLREMLYPLMQGYDSVAIKADVELGGNDQWFNLLAGRKLQTRFNQNPQDIITTNLILGTDGRKMSSSWGNTINLTDAPKDMYGKIMSVPDELITSYLTHCTRVSMNRIKEVENLIKDGNNPRDLKMELARVIVGMFHGEKNAQKAEEDFVDIFQKGKVVDSPVVSVEGGTLLKHVLIKEGVVSSGNEFSRLIDSGSISTIDGAKIVNKQAPATSNTFKIGPRRTLTINIK
ncbi:tyrosine--tRNA ligase [Candidatus Kaiserbacteria bacterium]|nr:tyrosine--tRNA ligase [Candidatus Kaiserbacteria bacterium]